MPIQPLWVNSDKSNVSVRGVKKLSEPMGRYLNLNIFYKVLHAFRFYCAKYVKKCNKIQLKVGKFLKIIHQKVFR